MLKYTVAGESHGDSLVAIIEGLPYKTPIDIDYINGNLRLRNKTYGRGSRMKIENDKVEVLTGIRNGYALSSPLTLRIKNSVSNIDSLGSVTTPRPGHADLPAMKKYRSKDARDFLEFASARLTAIRTAVGSLAESIIRRLDIVPICRVIQVGDINCGHATDQQPDNDLFTCQECYPRFKDLISKTMDELDTIGGAFELRFNNLPAGVGSIMPFEKRLNSRFFRALSSIQTVRAVELGEGVSQSRLKGSAAHGKYIRGGAGIVKENDISGGIEGGISNGAPVALRCYCKPVSTVRKGFESVDAATGEKSGGKYERTDTFTVASCSLIARTLMSFELLSAIDEQFHCDNYGDFVETFMRFRDSAKGI